MADYIELVDFTGREMHPGKRGKIEANEPKALTKLGLDKNHLTTRVKMGVRAVLQNYFAALAAGRVGF